MPLKICWASAEFWPAKLLWTSAEFWQQTQESRQKQFRHSIQKGEKYRQCSSQTTRREPIYEHYKNEKHTQQHCLNLCASKSSSKAPDPKRASPAQRQAANYEQNKLLQKKLAAKPLLHSEFKNICRGLFMLHRGGYSPVILSLRSKFSSAPEKIQIVLINFLRLFNG